VAVGICLRWQRGAAPGRAVAAIFAVFFMSASFLTIQPHSESISANPPALLTDETVTHALDSIGGYFIENKGQVADGIRYYSTGNPSVGFRDDGVMFVIRETSREERKEAWRSPIDYSTAIDEATTVRSLAYMLRFEESNKVTPIGIDRLPFNSNFFIGNDPSGWRTDVPNFAEVAYEGLYEGIDLVYHQAPGGLKYEFVVHPGADPRSISLSYEGVDSLRVDDAALIAVTPLGEVHDSVPYSHQAGREVTCSFAVRRPGSYGFDCENWDRSTNLIIDPLVYSTFLGGGFDSADSIAVDSSGNAYVSGGTYSTDFPVTPGVLNTTLNGYEDIFVTKLNPGGSSIIYSTYLGGNGRDGWAFVYASSIAVDSFGGAFVTGGTNSVDFPVTPTAYDPWFNGYWDAFVVRLNVTGNRLAYSTYLGGNAGDWGNGIAVDLSGSAYVTGETWSVGFPVTPGAFDRRLDGFYDAFVAKLDSTGGSLLYSTYLGGNGDELGYSIAIDSIGNAYVTGGAWSAGFPVTPGAFDTTFNLSIPPSLEVAARTLDIPSR
jgi:hypothetical protein